MDTLIIISLLSHIFYRIDEIPERTEFNETPTSLNSVGKMLRRNLHKPAYHAMYKAVNYLPLREHQSTNHIFIAVKRNNHVMTQNLRPQFSSKEERCHSIATTMFKRARRNETPPKAYVERVF